MLVCVAGEAPRAGVTEACLLLQELCLGGDPQRLEPRHRLVHAPGADRLDEAIGAVQEIALLRVDRLDPDRVTRVPLNPHEGNLLAW